MPGPGLLRRPAVALFILVLLPYAYFYQAGGWNQNSRFDLVRSIVEERTSVIDRYYRNTGDLSCRGAEGRCLKVAPKQGRHAYCDKAPGLSWLAVPAYAAFHLAAGSEQPSPRYLAAASHLSTVWAVAIPAALGVVMLYLLLGALGLSLASRTAVTLAYGLATLAFPYATLFYGHQLVAALLLIGFALLVRSRRGDGEPPGKGLLVGVGVILGFSVVVEYPAALAVAPIAIYAATFVRPWQRLGWLVAGMALPGLMLAAYHWSVFGGPLTLPYEFSTQGNRSQGFFMGLGAPAGKALWGILFSGYRGLSSSAPWLLLAIPGGVLLWRRGYRSETIVCGAVVLLFVWLNASLVDWQGGWAMGPRYLIPAIPFLAILAAGLAATDPALRHGSSRSRGPGSGRTDHSGNPPATGKRSSAGAESSSNPPVRAEAENSGNPPVRPEPGATAPESKDGHSGWLTPAIWLVSLGAAAYSFFLMLVGTAVKPEVHDKISRPFSQYLLERFYAGDLAVSTQSIDSIGPARDGHRYAWNLGQLVGLDGLASLIPLAVLMGGAAYWLVWASRRAGSTPP